MTILGSIHQHPSIQKTSVWCITMSSWRWQSTGCHLTRTPLSEPRYVLVLVFCRRIDGLRNFILDGKWLWVTFVVAPGVPVKLSVSWQHHVAKWNAVQLQETLQLKLPSFNQGSLLGRTSLLFTVLVVICFASYESRTHVKQTDKARNKQCTSKFATGKMHSAVLNQTQLPKSHLRDLHKLKTTHSQNFHWSQNCLS